MIGIMQGRLLPPSARQIQEFHWDNWHEEFFLASQIGINLIEWNLVNAKNEINPLLSVSGRKKIETLSQEHQILINSITLECLLDAPLHRKNPFTNKQTDISELKEIIRYSANLGIRIGVIPLVKESGYDDLNSLSFLIELLRPLQELCTSVNFFFALECEFDTELLSWLSHELINEPHIGFNFDTGNGAAIGNDPIKEIKIYGDKLFNVHVKDRLLHGNTVPLGQGNTNFPIIFRELHRVGYSGNYIIQAARQTKFKEKETIIEYLNQCSKLIALQN
jgi:L-ribulose-5-phosphate 3-epimerase